MYIQGIIAGIFLSVSSVPTRWKFDNNGKKYNDQPALIGLVGHFNLDINPEITALDSLTMPLVDLRIVKWRNSFIPIRIQEISPPLQHQFAFVDKLRLMDICRPY